MNKPKFIFKVFLLLLAPVVCLTAAFAQTEPRQPAAIEPSYEIVLQIITAANNPGEKAPLPQSFAPVVKKLKTLYAFSDYRLTATFLQRTSSTIEYKSMLGNFMPAADNAGPVFSEWMLRNLRSVPNAQGRNTIQFENFRFGARVPVTMQSARDESGKLSPPVVNYESIGITSIKMSVNENEPTVVGSLSTSRPDELIFLVLTIKAAE